MAYDFSHLGGKVVDEPDYGRGNIDLNNRPVVKNPDGSISTVNSMTVGIDGKYYLLPGVNENRKLSGSEAIDQFKKTGKHLGVFDSEEEANKYGEDLHKSQEARYVSQDESPSSVDFSHLGGKVLGRSDQPQQPQGFVEQALNNPLTQFTLGAGAAVQKPFYEAGNIINRGLGLAEMPMPQGVTNDSLAGSLGTLTGDIAGFAGAGGLLKGALKGMEAAPLIGKSAQYLGKSSAIPTTLRDILTGAGYGGLVTPENRTMGAVVGGALGAIPGAATGVKKIGSVLMGKGTPVNLAKKIIQDLGQGNGIEQNALSLAKDIRKNAKGIYNNYSDTITPVLDKLGNEKINLESYINNVNGSDITATGAKKMEAKFLKDPTLQNAHWLQSQYGHEVRKLTGTDAATVEKKDIYKEAQKSIQDDIQKFLSSKDPELAKQYSSAQKYYAENYVPYKNASIIQDIIKEPAYGKTESPFATTEKKKISARSIVDALKGINLNGPSSKIASDLSPLAKNKVLFSELGKSTYSKPESLANALAKLDEKGLLPYADESLKNSLEHLGKSIKYRKAGKTALTAVGLSGIGAETAHLLGGF